MFVMRNIKNDVKLPMKKLLLIPFIALFAVACSTDTEDLDNYANAQKTMASSASPIIGGTYATISQSCFSQLGAHPFYDATNGLNNGTLSFISEPPASAFSGSYKVRVEIEEVSDCEDLGSGTGNIKTFTTGATYTNVVANAPKVTGVKPADTFACYRWRMVFEGVGRNGAVTCTTASQWYDAPLF